jgi:hypothetical protein
VLSTLELEHRSKFSKRFGKTTKNEHPDPLQIEAGNSTSCTFAKSEGSDAKQSLVNTNENDDYKKEGSIVMNNNLGSLVRVGIMILLLLLSLGFLGQSGMMGNWGYSLFGSMGMILMWLIPVGLIVLTFFGFVRFIRGRPKQPSSTDTVCLHCGNRVQADWRFCPFCGGALTSNP